MSTLLTINLRNDVTAIQDFYFFQRPAVHSSGSEVYSNSLFTQTLGNYAATGSVLTFQVSMQPYAGIQQTHTTPQVGQSSGFASASRAIELAASSGSSDDWTTASVSPLGLSPPAAGAGVAPGAFRVTTPQFQPPAMYNVGTAVEANGSIVLSSFVVASPNSNTDCQPILKYYVQTGMYKQGTVMDFTQSCVNAAICDFTSGYSVIDVTLNADGSWTVHRT